MQKAGLDKDAVRALLPNVGDVLIKKPYVYNATIGLERPKPQRCVVEYVNRDHLWYKVRFEGGWTECYKAPELVPDNKGGWGKR